MAAEAELGQRIELTLLFGVCFFGIGLWTLEFAVPQGASATPGRRERM